MPDDESGAGRMEELPGGISGSDGADADGNADVMEPLAALVPAEPSTNGKPAYKPHPGQADYLAIPGKLPQRGEARPLIEVETKNAGWMVNGWLTQFDSLAIRLEHANEEFCQSGGVLDGRDANVEYALLKLSENGRARGEYKEAIEKMGHQRTNPFERLADAIDSGRTNSNGQAQRAAPLN